MNCRQVGQLLEAYALEERRFWARETSEAFGRHVGACDPCRRSVAVADRLERDLRGLPEVRVPQDLAAGVMARTVRAADRREWGPMPTGERSSGEGISWSALAAGASIGAAGWVWGALAGVAPAGLLPDLQNGSAAISGLPEVTAAAVLVAAAGLGLYLVGLTGPTSDGPESNGSGRPGSGEA